MENYGILQFCHFVASEQSSCFVVKKIGGDVIGKGELEGGQSLSEGLV